MTPFTTYLLRLSLWVVVVILALGAVVVQAQIPPDAAKYKRLLLRNAQLVWGLDAPVSTFAAQIHQESGWRPDVVSPVGASGLAQFMPATAKWMGTLNSSLVDNDPTNPSWAIRALVEYDKWLYERANFAYDKCERMAFVLSGYNGGWGWVLRDRQLAREDGVDHNRWFGYVENYNAGRANWAIKENRGYPDRILRTLERRYHDAGWGARTC